jgi:hypothetical protein
MRGGVLVVSGVTVRLPAPGGPCVGVPVNDTDTDGVMVRVPVPSPATGFWTPAMTSTVETVTVIVPVRVGLNDPTERPLPRLVPPMGTPAGRKLPTDRPWPTDVPRPAGAIATQRVPSHSYSTTGVAATIDATRSVGTVDTVDAVTCATRNDTGVAGAWTDSTVTDATRSDTDDSEPTDLPVPVETAGFVDATIPATRRAAAMRLGDRQLHGALEAVPPAGRDGRTRPTTGTTGLPRQ